MNKTTKNELILARLGLDETIKHKLIPVSKNANAVFTFMDT